MFVFLTFPIKPIKAEQIFVSICIAFPLRCVHFSKSDSAHKPVIRFHAVDIGFCNGFHAVQSVWNQPQIRHRTHDPRQRQQPMPALKKGIARFDLPRRRKSILRINLPFAVFFDSELRSSITAWSREWPNRSESRV